MPSFSRKEVGISFRFESNHILQRFEFYSFCLKLPCVVKEFQSTVHNAIENHIQSKTIYSQEGREDTRNAPSRPQACFPTSCLPYFKLCVQRTRNIKIDTRSDGRSKGTCFRLCKQPYLRYTTTTPSLFEFCLYYNPPTRFV